MPTHNLTDRWPAKVEPAFGRLSVVRPLPWQSGSSIFSQAPSPFSGRTTESRPGYSQRHDVEPTEIGRRRALALAPPILVVWCASHLLTSVLCVHTSNTLSRVKGLKVFGLGQVKVCCEIACDKCDIACDKCDKCDIACDIAFVACDKCDENLLDTTV